MIGVPKRSFSENFRPIDHERVVQSEQKEERKKKKKKKEQKDTTDPNTINPLWGRGFKNYSHTGTEA